jgi:signal transduction histidine kinase
MMEKGSFWLKKGPPRGILEAWGIALGILFLLSRLEGRVPGAVLSNGLVVLCGATGLWAVARIRLPEGGWSRQVLWEIGVGLALSLAMAAGLLGSAALLGWDRVWLQSNLRSTLPFALLLLGIGPGYLLTRGVLRLYLFWNRLRRRRMVWSLTHAHLTVVVIAGILIGMILTFGPLRYSSYDLGDVRGHLGLLIAENFLHTLFPTATVMALMGTAVMVIVLPPSALFSFLVARRTTRRLEDLTAAADALRAGEYGTRVEVEGEDEVAQLQADFNAMAAELEGTLEKLAAERDKVAELSEARRDLVASVSHELRTPVATIRSTLESLRPSRRADVSKGWTAHDLDVMANEVLQLQRLIDDLFTLSRAEVDGLDLNLQAVDVAHVVQRRVGALAPLAWDRGRVEVVAELPDDLPAVKADEGRLDQVLTNLLRNAVHHTGPGGIVAMVAAAEPEAVRVEVRDTGEGIPPEELDHVWERFYRGTDSRASDVQGAGLGLALVKELTEAMGGRVAVESEVGKGSVFAVWLSTRSEMKHKA